MFFLMVFNNFIDAMFNQPKKHVCIRVSYIIIVNIIPIRSWQGEAIESEQWTKGKGKTYYS